LLAAGATAFNILSRGWRWANLFRPHYRVSRAEASRLFMIGLAVNATLPARLGDFLRLGLAIRRFGAGFSFTLSTIVLERLLDAFILLVLLGGSLFYAPHLNPHGRAAVLGYELSGDMVLAAFRGIGVGFVLAAIVAIALASGRIRRWVIAATLLIPVMGRWLHGRIAVTLDGLGRGLEPLRRPGRLTALMLLSLASWVALAFCNFLVGLAIPGVALSFPQALVITAVTVAVSTLPSAPGAWGVFEAGALLSLALLGIEIDPAVAVSYAVMTHLCQYLPVVLLGMGAAVVGRGRRDLPRT
jgi:uncharacterized membrane protein YbhN (UPF0104 family)